MNPHTKRAPTPKFGGEGRAHISYLGAKNTSVRYGVGVKRALIFALFLYILALLQTSFLVHFKVAEIFPNLVLIAVIILNFFEDSRKNSGIISAFLGGFFLDIFSNRPMGFYILILIALAIFIKFILKKYVRVPIIKKV